MGRSSSDLPDDFLEGGVRCLEAGLGSPAELRQRGFKIYVDWDGVECVTAADAYRVRQRQAMLAEQRERRRRERQAAFEATIPPTLTGVPAHEGLSPTEACLTLPRRSCWE